MHSQTEEHEQIIICKKLIDSKDYQGALKKINEHIEKRQNDVKLLNDKGIILTKLGKYDEAIQIFEEAVEKTLKNVTKETKDIIWNNKGLVYCNKNQFDSAIHCFKMAFEENKELTHALNNKGLAYYYKGKKEKGKEKKEYHFKEAIECFNKVIESNPINSNAFNNKGSALVELGWLEEAVTCIYKSIELNSKNANALNNRGRILANSAKYTEAIDYYNKALEIEVNHKEALNNKGIALANLANLTDDDEYFEGAKDCYDKAIHIDKHFVDAINNKSMLYVRKGKLKKANELIKQSLDIDKENTDTIDKKGIILFHLNKYEDALSYFKKAIEINPENKISRYHMGNVYMEMKRYDDAIECFDDPLKDNLTFAEAHNAKASAYFAKGNQKEASKEVKRAIEIKPSLAVANENISKLTSSASPHFQNFWDFWKSSIFKRIVGITLVVLILGIVGSITYHIIINMSPISNITPKGQLIDMPEDYLIILGIILFVLLVPEIKKAKMGPMEFELEEQHIHPIQDSPSMSEEHHFSYDLATSNFKSN